MKLIKASDQSPSNSELEQIIKELQFQKKINLTFDEAVMIAERIPNEKNNQQVNGLYSFVRKT
jgi:hypothetical protein